MRNIVVDASVILKWVIGEGSEPDQDRAMAILDEWAEGNVDIHVPALWQYEVANFLGRESPHEAEEKMGMLRDLGLKEVVLTDGMLKRCFQWMKTFTGTFYDASYLAVAYESGAVLITADVSFAKKMGAAEMIMALKDLDLSKPLNPSGESRKE